MREEDELSTKTTPRYKNQWLFSINYQFKMTDKSNDGSYKPRKSKKERVWTNTEMKYLALVLAEEKNQYAVRLETLALKKSSNNQVFEEISKDFEKLLLSDEFKEERKNAKKASPKASRKTVHWTSVQPGSVLNTSFSESSGENLPIV